MPSSWLPHIELLKSVVMIPNLKETSLLKLCKKKFSSTNVHVIFIKKIIIYKKIFIH